MSVDIPLNEGKLKKKGKGLLSSNLVTPLDLPGVFSLTWWDFKGNTLIRVNSRAIYSF